MRMLLMLVKMMVLLLFSIPQELVITSGYCLLLELMNVR